jgi:type I site-specific restriction endonuclease
MASESVQFHVKAKIIEWLLKGMPKTLRSWREADIQVAKLDRMATKFDKKFPFTSILTVPAKQLRRNKGPVLKGLAQQSKRVDEAVAKLMEENNNRLVTSNAATRKQLRMGIRQYVHSLNQTVHEVAKQTLLTAGFTQSPKKKK